MCLFVFMYMHVCLVEFICITCVFKCQRKPVSVGSPGTRVRGYCELLDVGALVSLQEQCALVTALPSPPHRTPLTDSENKAVCWWGDGRVSRPSRCYVRSRPSGSALACQGISRTPCVHGAWLGLCEPVQIRKCYLTSFLFLFLFDRGYLRSLNLRIFCPIPSPVLPGPHQSHFKFPLCCCYSDICLFLLVYNMWLFPWVTASHSAADK